MSIVVSVCIVTYNQEKFIGETLESVLSQNADLNFEVIIGDDCSTDNTRKIIDEYYFNFPNKITRIYHNENIGPINNLKATYRAAKGKYICHLDGDDLMLPNKIQKQYETLEANQDCFICSHDINIINAENKYLKSWKHKSGIFNEDYLYTNLPFFAHSSKMFRNCSLDYLDLLRKDSIDIEIHIEQVHFGSIFHISESLGAYREGVGMTIINNKLNPVIPLAVMRVYENKLNLNPMEFKLKKLDYVYSRYLFRFARTYFKQRSEYFLFCKLIERSLSLKIFSLKQFFLFIFVFYPLSLWRFNDRS